MCCKIKNFVLSQSCFCQSSLKKFSFRSTEHLVMLSKIFAKISFVTQCREISVFWGYFSEKIKNDTGERKKSKKFFVEKKLTREILFKDFVS